MRKLTEFEKHVIEQKGTERPFSGEYNQHGANGVYCCKKCDAPLYHSDSKFNAHCGWPAFDDEIAGAVKRNIDADGRRVEIVCSRCDGHLGHVFEGEFLTPKNVRHCVNSVSMTFKSADELDSQRKKLAVATLGGGCFWCIEAVFSAIKGVEKVTSGYAGGDAADANYRAVCSGETAHAEVVQIEFDPEQVSFESLLEVFWVSHDPTTLNRQGNDRGPQYRSVIFIHDEEQALIANSMIADLTKVAAWPDPIVTEVVAYAGFFAAENYHNDYFELNGEQPYCQMVVKPKVDKVKALFADKLK
ncbi:peptide methionine sulfoxide reductase MsrA [Shewanella sairae]|uniref:Peptide methionine sulfoxide reductase MsrA n=1 Tax=Shewanella sairae TaxID=190310 RepID=A0ABQ4P663_9GAMM|nr:bifunctional methionine sulfoxide reductase B/A protein [Shewanella sairae]MCL1130737.1 bifunctional methionine sulfoxide reductase B/A protein [Shewanella sairae]GIU43030.1 peptide methionine sulfoxide reductase MsrA [Shewanella sairae]